MSLYNKASLIQVPSLYKDGLLVSTVPEDRSGDFAVARGANLSATRIGEDGYIKKGYENLLLQSNSFDTSTWIQVNILPPTSGQTGYDGSTDAWYFEKVGAFGRLQQSISTSGVQTLSVYVKAKDSSWVNVEAAGTNTSRQYFDLTNISKGLSNNIISSSIVDAGDGWRKCSITYEGTKTFAFIYIAEGNAQINGTTGSLYIQDVMLNQGLVAYPYLETTDAPAQGGLLENTPRLDWSNGVPAVKLEKGSTNLVAYSEYFGAGWNLVTGTSIQSNADTSPEGVENATRVTSINHNEGLEYRNIAVTENTSYTFSWYGKVTSGSQTPNYSIRDASNNAVIDSGAWPIVSNTEYKRQEVSFTTPAGCTNLWVRVSFYSGSAVDYYIYGAQLEAGSTPSSYIPTYGTSQTRSNETVSDTFTIPTTATIYNSFYSDVAEQVYVLDQVFNVSVGLNKVAIAFSPTAIKISVGGSITANATGTYDTTSLSNIQLGSNNGTDYSNAPISGFYVFPEFLTDAELNSLTD